MENDKMRQRFRMILKVPQTGQALIEYVLILVLIAIAFGFALAVTGPVVGNVFSNVVFNVLQQTPPSAQRVAGGPGDFWLTVTWVASNPLEERPLPTRTDSPPTNTPTPGPSPTPTDVTPTRTPAPTNTPRPTLTPEDFAFNAPYLDTVDNPEYWRVDAQPFLGVNDFKFELFTNTDLTGSPLVSEWNREVFGQEFRGVIDFDWGSGPPTVSGPSNNFSIRWTRRIFIDDNDGIQGVNIAGPTQTITFNLRSDDGSRLWIFETDEDGFGSNQNTGNCATACKIIDGWSGGGNQNATVTLAPGTYILQVDYREFTGGAYVALDYGIAPNVDDTVVDGGGSPTGGTPECNWNDLDRYEDANSLEFMWNGEDINTRTRCYLEFRGYVDLAPGGAPLVNPQFSFWDVWDFGNSGVTGWLEVAEYIPEVPPDGRTLNRGATNWIPVVVHPGTRTNYAWTRQVINLADVQRNGAGGADDFTGKKVTFRFAIQNTNTGNTTRRWYVDDIELRSNNTQPDFLPGTFIDLNGPNTEDKFITSGQWGLTTTNARGSECCSWELRPNGNYTYFWNSPNNSSGANPGNHRVHAVELNGWIDYGGGIPDDEGDTGAPILSFFHGYDLARYTGLEVQYTTDAYGTPGGENWIVVPEAGANTNPHGRLVSINNSSNTTYRDQQALVPVDVSLAQIPATRFRLRFAMLVRRDSNVNSSYDGWWIDDIYLHREGLPNYLDYPFFDSAETGIDNWLTSGWWARTTEAAYGGTHSFTDSPGANYLPNFDTYIRTIDPIDFRNNTPTNLALTDRNPAGGNTFAAPAVNPALTFWHRRDLQRDDDLILEWRAYNETESQWKRLWAYMYRMNTDPNNTSDRSNRSLAWEYVEVDLSVITQTFGADVESDDIMFRFRLDSDSNTNVSDGVWLDDIRITERVDLVHKLWPSTENRTVGAQNFGTGTSASFGADLDESNWFTKWKPAGDWAAIQWEQYNGLQGWHESPSGQSIAPYNERPSDALTSDYTATRADSFSVLELAPIFDLRATNVNEKPTLYFWTRYQTGNDDGISVQISQEMTQTGSALDTAMASRCGGYPQCYEQIRGWGSWQNAEFNVRSDWSSNYGWTRQQVALDGYAASGTTAGKRIRIRFVYDALDNNQNNKRDGWFIDAITIGQRRDAVKQRIVEGNFTDLARNLTNWVTEGNWGLSPVLFSGAGGGPVTLGTWNESFWDCQNCANLAPGGTPSNQRMPVGTDIFLDNDGVTSLGPRTPVTRIIQDINYDIRRGAPRPGVFDKTDQFVGRWTLVTPVVGGSSGVPPGDYTFFTQSDDGVRMKYVEIDAAGNPVNPLPPNPPPLLEWNMIYNWSNHGKTGDMGVATLENGKRYRLTIEWYEGSGDAVLQVSVGGNSFSFTDSPRQGAGVSFPDIPALPYAETSLVLNGTLDLNGTVNPIMVYSEYYEIDGWRGVEVSIDGGFTWTQSRLGDDITYPSGVTDTMDNPSLGGGRYLPENGLWRERKHNLTFYRNGPPIMIRFRLSRLNNWCLSNDNTCNPGSGSYNANGWFVSWWIVDITVGN